MTKGNEENANDKEIIGELEGLNDWLSSSTAILNNTLGILQVTGRKEEVDSFLPQNNDPFTKRCHKVIDQILGEYEEYLGLNREFMDDEG